MFFLGRLCWRDLGYRLPAPWKPCESEDGEIFYFNFETGRVAVRKLELFPGKVLGDFLLALLEFCMVLYGSMVFVVSPWCQDVPSHLLS